MFFASRIWYNRRMPDAPESLVFDLVEWVAKEPRSYAEMLDAWRTSCPRLTVWEDAIERGLVMRKPVAGRGTIVVITQAGRRFLAEREPVMSIESVKIAMRRAS
jgi:hypothetical protein